MLAFRLVRIRLFFLDANIVIAVGVFDASKSMDVFGGNKAN